MAESIIRPMPKLNGFALRRPRLFPILVFVAILMCLALVFVWSRIELVSLEYKISSKQDRLRALQQEGNLLQIEAATLSNPVRIEQMARTRLSLRMPSSEQVVTIR
ncbi:MAG: cell division protein FtsL [Desulfuromonadales bacterium]|nr:cell division protein FtsL [Desulfuromonadales bacterium]